MDTKTCNKCGLELLIDQFRLANKETGKRRSTCLNCERKLARESMQKRRAKFPETVKQQKRESYYRNLDAASERNRRNYIENREQRLAYAAEYREKNKDYIREWVRQYREANPSKVKESHKRYYQRHKGKRIFSVKQYQETNRIETRLRNRARKEKLRFSKKDFSQQDWVFCLEYWNHKCAVCGCSADANKLIAADHWIPIAKDGKTSKTNIVPLCHGINGCNNSKSSHMPQDWLITRYDEETAAIILTKIHDYFSAL